MPGHQEQIKASRFRDAHGRMRECGRFVEVCGQCRFWALDACFSERESVTRTEDAPACKFGRGLEVGK